jgi:hypothetical protein
MPKRHERIAFVKTAWSDQYDGEEVRGKYRWVASGHQGHEKFNFRRGPDGACYAAIPPIGRKSSPKPKRKDRWLLIFISAEEGKGPLKVVGWFENANFENRPIPRPEYKSNPNFEKDDKGKQYCYSVSSHKTRLILADQRPLIAIGDHMKRSPILYVRGNNKAEPWRDRPAKEAEELIKRFAPTKKTHKTSSHADRNGQPWYANKELKAKVDKKAVQYVKHMLKTQYDIQDRQPDRCGYDLLATSRDSSVQLCVEVKGTSRERPGFFMTPKELAASQSRKWRLALVTNALTTPKCQLLSKREMVRRFDIRPCSYVGIFKSDPS